MNNFEVLLQDIEKELTSIVGEKYVTRNEVIRYTYTRTPTWPIKRERIRIPALIVRPGSTEEVVEIVRLANRYKIPVIPRGGGASIAGWLVTNNVDKSILIDLTRMNKVLEIDKEHFTVTAECGILLGELHKILRENGLHIFTVDVPFYIDTLGGALSGVVGGGEPSDLATSGELYHYVLGLKVVLPTGVIIQTGAGPHTNIYQQKVVDRAYNSPDITSLFLGDGGIFGIKVEATLVVEPWPSQYRFGAFIFNSFESSWKCFNKLVSTAPYLYSHILLMHTFEMKDWGLLYAIRAHLPEELALKHSYLSNICKFYGGSEISTEEALKLGYRYGTRDIGRTFGSRGHFIYFEGAFPRNIVPVAYDKIKSFLESEFLNGKLNEKVIDWVEFMAPKLRTSVILGFLVFFDNDKLNEDDIDKLIDIQEKYSDLRFKLGGFIEMHHGFEAFHAASVWSKEYKEFISLLKRALDPNNILNPGLWGINYD